MRLQPAPFVLVFIAILSASCSALPQDVGQAVQGTMQALTAQASLIETQVAIQLTQAAPTSTSLPIENNPPQPSPTSTSGATDNIPTFTPPAGQSGSISGTLSYPAEGIPAMAIIAYVVGGSPNDYYYVTTDQGENSYQIFNLPVGAYHIVAYTLGGGGFPAGLAGGYTQAVPCGLSVSCTDHSLIAVQVNNGQDTANANPQDWYAPDGTFPAYPLP
jgi:hypothetical protein